MTSHPASWGRSSLAQSRHKPDTASPDQPHRRQRWGRGPQSLDGNHKFIEVTEAYRALLLRYLRGTGTPGLGADNNLRFLRGADTGGGSTPASSSQSKVSTWATKPSK